MEQSESPRYDSTRCRVSELPRVIVSFSLPIFVARHLLNCSFLQLRSWNLSMIITYNTVFVGQQ